MNLNILLVNKKKNKNKNNCSFLVMVCFSCERRLAAHGVGCPTVCLNLHWRKRRGGKGGARAPHFQKRGGGAKLVCAPPLLDRANVLISLFYNLL